MFKKFEKQMVAKTSVELLTRHDCIVEIKQIFNHILLNPHSALRQHVIAQGLNFNEFKLMLQEYQEALIEEVNFLPVQHLVSTSNHPLRAAVALSNLNVQQTPNAFLLNLETFAKEARDSHFYPRTKTIVSGIIIGLLFVVMTAMLCCLFTFAGSLNLLAAVSTAVGFDVLVANNSLYRPIYEAKKLGSRINEFFSHANPQLAIAGAEILGQVNADSSDQPPKYTPPEQLVAII